MHVTVNMAASDVTDELARLRAENETLKQQVAPGNDIRFKVSPKGCVSAYFGTGRFPVSLYAEQWNLLLENIEGLKQFINNNKEHLKPKPGSPPTQS